MDFLKYHGSGNDFVLVNALEAPPAEERLPEMARALCDRHFGIGADGLLLVLPGTTASLRMRILNPDGSEAEMCGNGIRCFAKYVYDHGVARQDRLRVETLAGIMVPEVILEGGRVARVRVDMGEPRLARREIPMEGPDPEGRVLAETIPVEGKPVTITAVSMGNPHCVVFVEDAPAYPVAEVGPRLEAHPLFPRRTNVEFVQVLGRAEIEMRVWERGAGQTLACGTGACASVVAAVLNGLTDRSVTVHLAGGDLLIEWGEDNRVHMTGPAEEVFSGTTHLV